MLRLTELRLPLDHSEEELRAAILRELGIEPQELVGYSIFRRSFDARKRGAIALIYHLDVETTREEEILRRLRGHPDRFGPTPDTSYRFVSPGAARIWPSRPVVIGMGPCGLFAGLLLAEMGFRPIILERGKEVRERTVDTFGLWRKGILDPESNVQFGEGGAGTFSDGKLYSQIKDPEHRGRKVLTEFVEAGAPPEILFVNKPHIGTFRLVKMVESHAGEDRVAGRRDPLSEPGRGSGHRAGKGAGGDPRRRRAPGGGSRDPGGRPQRPGHLRDAPAPGRLHRSQTLFHRVSHRASPDPSSTAAASGRRRGTRSSAPPITSWSTTAATAGRSTASACARAARWWRRLRSPDGWSPTA